MTLDEAWTLAERWVPENWDLWVAATGPGFVAQTNGPGEQSVQAWSQGDRALPDYDPAASPASALLRLAEKLAAK